VTLVTSPGPSWISTHRRVIVFAAAIVLTFVCPYLPGPFSGPCRIVATALQTGTFNGIPIPGLDDAPAAADAGSP
jgi:hypothetical protein